MELLYRFDQTGEIAVRFMGHVEYDSSWQHFERQENGWILYYILSGDMYICEGDTKYHLRENDFFLLEPYKTHRGYKPAACHYYYVHFHANALEPTLLPSRQAQEKLFQARERSMFSSHTDYSICDSDVLFLPKQYTFTYPWEAEDILKAMDHVFFEKLEGRRTIAKLRFTELLIRICRNYCDGFTSNKNPKSFLAMRQVQAFIHENYTHELSREDIEAVSQLNYDYVNRLFKKTTGYTVRNYINLTRINQAKILLLKQSMNVGQVGEKVGIPDPFYFTKFFKKHTGMTPTEYLKTAKELDLPSPEAILLKQ